MDFKDIYRLTITNQFLSMSNQYLNNGDTNIMISGFIIFIALAYAWFEIQPADIKKQWITSFQNRMREIYCYQSKSQRSVLYMRPHILTTTIEYTSEKQKRTHTSLKYRALVDYLMRNYSEHINEYHDSVNYVRIRGENATSSNNYNIMFIPGTSDIELENGIMCRIQYKLSDERVNESDTYFSMFELYINQPHKTGVIFDFLKRREQEFVDRRTNDDKKFGQKIFEYSKRDTNDEDNDDDDRKNGYQIYRFKSNKFLDKNVFFEGKEKMIAYVSQFINDESVQKQAEEDYMRSGVTFKAGMLFYGVPGCGKSTTIKAILNMTRRNGVYLNLNRIKTCSEFSSIFRSGKINGIQYHLNELCFIIEDFDANHCSVLKRRDTIENIDSEFCMLEPAESMDSIQDASGQPLVSGVNGMDENDMAFIKKSEKLFNKNSKLGKIIRAVSKTIPPDTVDMNFKKNGKEDDTLTLECVLNVLDGVIELHNAMFIFTTNHPNMIDPALLRPGRIDYRQEFKRASKKVLRDMFQFKFELDEDTMATLDFDSFKDEVMTPAEIQSTMFLYKKEDYRECFKALRGGEPKVPPTPLLLGK
jgi:hypothetical protein